MKRRTFLQGAAAASALTLISEWPKVSLGADGNAFEEAFIHPSVEARPKTWWHWMNGNITADGITRDLEAMHRAGVGGFQIFQVGTGIPKGPVDYSSPEHLKLLEHAANEADRLGLEFDMMNCPGWSSSGGPWITPELSMQQLTWSETFVSGGREINVVLPEPYKKHDYYQDALVLAFPSLEGEDRPLKDLLRQVSSSSGEADRSLLTDNDFSKGIEIRPAAPGQSAYLQMEFDEPYSARSIMVYVGPPLPGGSDHWPQLRLESSDDGAEFQKVCDLEVPRYRSSQDVPGIASFPEARAKYFRLVASDACIISQVSLSGAVRISEWPRKANFIHRAGQKPFGATGDVPKGSVIDPEKVMDITGHMDGNGRLQWQAPSGKWTILRMGQTTTGVQNHPAPDGGLGLECDKYSRAAYDYHFNHFFGDLIPKLHSLTSKGRAGVVIDSYEVGMQTWTKHYPEEFQRLRGYDLRKYLPATTGRVVESGDVSDRFLWDIRRTDADLMDNHYYGRFAELCHEHGLKAYSEPYSGGPFEEIGAGSSMDVPMGEFWAGQGNHYSIKLASSIAHVFGQRVVGAESYTGDPRFAKWLEYPYALKAQGDWMYTQGLNEFIFHVYAMQPHPTAKPGMTMGPWGWMHSRTNTWFIRESAWLNYVRRCQHLLREGVVVADLIYYQGAQVPVSTPVLPDQLNPTPPLGYYYDVTNAEGILNRMQAGNGKIVLPDGMSYRVLVLPEYQTITLELLRKIRDLVNGGAVVVGPKPLHTPGLTAYPDSDAELRRLADEVWGDLDGTTKTERSFGQGRVFWGEPIKSVLEKLNIKPDFEFTSRSGDAPINFIHRREGETDIYFIANRRRQPEDLVCTFRVENKRPEFWNPENGEITPAEVYDLVDGGVRLPVRLGPAGSTFVVFRAPAEGRRLEAITKDGTTLEEVKPFPALVPGRYRDVANNFTISVWVNPGVDLGLPPHNAASVLKSGFGAHSYVIYPPSGNDVYGAGQAACGLAVGRDGVLVYERSKGSPRPVLASGATLSGWTHLAVVYRSGAPSLYMNGKLLQQGRESDSTVHPGLGEAFERDGAAYFHGEMDKPELFREALGEGRIAQLVKAGAPAPEGPPALELAGNGTSELLIWQNGRYGLKRQGGGASSLRISGIETPEEIRGPWRVSFPPNLGAPPEVTLPELISLHEHSEEGVRYFSGTATYTNRFHVDAKAIAGGRRLYLDLGRVEVFAEVRVNGRNLGVLWKPPLRIDVTEAVHPGENNLEVLITNLWPNRLIGDEQLPPENEYDDKGGLFGGPIKSLPQWYLDGKPKPPGGRITFATWKHYDKDSPLIESGLIGPVVLRTAVRRKIIS
ncbi:MAG TPA: glycosyl hydrolase [Terriglobia bacterium]|nr:glycosyl hydrolase [Terriglobia bacterium]